MTGHVREKGDIKLRSETQVTFVFTILLKIYFI